jgi:4-amino-4-deoxy-L-arabinose transferase-like glycosyltransferase
LQHSSAASGPRPIPPEVLIVTRSWLSGLQSVIDPGFAAGSFMSEQTLDPTAIDPSTTARSLSVRQTRLLLAVLFVFFTLIWFASLGVRSLIHSDEGRYAALALEMARSGDWITPRLNGLLYFEKPALQYWIGALSFRWFGVSEFSARLWPGLAGFLTLLTVGLTAARLWGKEAGVQAFAITASTTWIVCNSHFLTLDTGLTLFLTLTLCAALLAECADLDPHVRRRWVWIAWAAMGGAVLSKGLVGVVIPGCVLLLASAWRRDFGLWRRMRPIPGGLIFLLIVAPWFVLVSLRNPGFAEFFFIHEHFARYLTHVHHREGAWWYYLPLLLAGLLPWTSGLPWLLRRDKSATRPADGMARSVLAIWCGFVLVFFSLSGSKLPSYILPKPGRPCCAGNCWCRLWYGPSFWRLRRRPTAWALPTRRRK